MEIAEPFDEKVKRIMRTFVKLGMPLLFPVLLFNSRLGAIFKTKVLGQV